MHCHRTAFGAAAEAPPAPTVELEGDAALTHDSDLVPPVGSVVGTHYRVLGVLGSGGMGTVLRALDEHLEREIALKLIHRDKLERADMRARFRSEARAMARVHHPNLVQIYAYGEHEGRPYFAMEFVPGKNLAAHKRDAGRSSLSEAMTILDQICRGVSTVHAAGTVHRDLKPSNVLLGPGHRVAVTDMGLAHLARSAEDAGTAQWVGTPAYLAPELARNEPLVEHLAARVDVYSLAVMTFEMLTGMLPYRARGLPALLAEHGYSPPPRPSSVDPDLPRGFDTPIMDAMAKDPAERTPSIERFRQRLQAVFDDACQAPPDLEILVADDDLSNLRATAALLEEVFSGATIRCATDGATAMKIAREASPSVVITDLKMPGHGGLELTAALRSDPSTAHVPIIVVTGHGGAKDWKVLRALGADRFLVKPVDPTSLINEIRALVDPVDGTE